MKSSTYQLSTRFEGQWKDAYVPYYARRFARVLSGPEAADIIAQATGSPYPLTEYGENLTYVKELTDPNSLRGGGSPEAKDMFAFMLAFYQAERTMPPVNKDLASPVQAMSMMSSPMVARRVSADGKNRVAYLLKSDKSQDEMIEELYLASLSRKPTAGEVEVAKRLMVQDRTKGTENLQWALLNSTEFLVNH